MVVRLHLDDGSNETVTGMLTGLRDGDRLRLTGKWAKHPKFGRQFEAESFVHIHPTTKLGLERFLGSGRIRGIGKELARRLVEKFGVETLEIIDKQPELLTQVRGIGGERARRIRESWEEHRSVQQIMVFLAGHGVSTSIALKAHRRYGPKALDVVRENPYRLAGEVFGVGFLTADKIARSLGVAEDAPQRLEAALVYSLQKAGVEGHVFLPRDRLISVGRQLLRNDEVNLEPSLERLNLESQVVLIPRGNDEPAVYLPRLYKAEASIAESFSFLLATRHERITSDTSAAIEWFERNNDLVLAARQREALGAALDGWAVVITGGPGTGKTTLIQGLTQICTKKEVKVLLAAPTGRAAKRLAEATSQPAKTVHRLLEFNPKTREFARCRQHPLDADVVVIDEVSMLDVEIAAHLFSAVPPQCRLVLVGDADQLPSVGPGNVLADMIVSGTVRVVRLSHIFRQEHGSLIVTNAHRINVGEMPYLKGKGETRDFFFLERDDPADAASTIIELATSRVPKRYDLDPILDLQVLCPMRRGPLGVSEINQRLQDELTPSGEQLTVGFRRFRVGDKVMQLRNNYDLDIFNGDIGRVLEVDAEDRELVVEFDGRSVAIPTDGLDDLVAAYATTIHKSQGSEYPAVIIALHHQHHIMLQRNLFYTAVTRGKRLVIVVGSKRGLSRAVRNATVRKRFTLLASRLREACRTS
ncbi:MAG: ATP-dependent RecD-like DNA helicase [bacterium]|nr:ATP-dependent RecD-like DNA helicase [bacterium]